MSLTPKMIYSSEAASVQHQRSTTNQPIISVIAVPLTASHSGLLGFKEMFSESPASPSLLPSHTDSVLAALTQLTLNSWPVFVWLQAGSSAQWHLGVLEDFSVAAVPLGGLTTTNTPDR